MEFPKRNLPWLVPLALVLLLAGGYDAFLAPPADFPADATVSIVSGSSAPHIAEKLAEERIVAHSAVLRLLLKGMGVSASVRAGAYRFNEPQNAFVIAFRLAAGDYGFPPVRLTIPEGATVREMGAFVARAFPEITADDFIAEAKPYEGYLFPDTYFFPHSTSADAIISAMRKNFDEKLAPHSAGIRASGRTLSEIITMASLLEKEARSMVARQTIAGILYNRLERSMPLQVDAVFGYIFDRDTFSPSYADLKVDSPYNTYTHTGLPPGPISNPGIDAIRAALNPARTNYFYYLTDKNGQMHYAETYAGHQANRRKYLP